MSRKPDLLSATGLWIFAAVACAALPILHSLPQVREIGAIVAVLGALALGAAIAAPLTLAARGLCGGEAGEERSWATLNAREAAALGVIGWGLPLGLIFATHDFLSFSSLLRTLPSLIIWALAGIASGLLSRRLAKRQDRKARGA